MITILVIAVLQSASAPGATLASEASRLGVTRIKLHDALASRERSPRFRPTEYRHCVEDKITDPPRVRRVCRSLADWHMLGFELMDEEPR
jgi:hypothetical protein